MTIEQLQEQLTAKKALLHKVELAIIDEQDKLITGDGNNIRLRDLNEKKAQYSMELTNLKKEIRSLEYLSKLPGDKHRAVHIITSAKGGVGKTLLALVLSSIYFKGFPGRSMLAIDMNSMNPDFSKLLIQDNSPMDPENDIGDFRLYEIKKDKLQIARPIDPYVVQDSKAFWHGIGELVSRTPKTDLVIDTNLYLANLDAEKPIKKGLINESFDWHNQTVDSLVKTLSEIIQVLLADERTIVYVWIVWTWDSLKEERKETLTNGIKLRREESIAQKAISNLSTIFQKRIAFLHVFNPSALVLPNTPIPNKEKVKDIAILKNVADNLRSKYSQDDQDPDDVDYSDQLPMVEELIEGLSQKVSTRFSPYEISGLVELSKDASKVKYIPFHEFTKLIPKDKYNNPKKAFFNICQKILDETNGRPWNVLPISTYNPALVGYTERWNGSFEEFRNVHKDLIEDIEDYIFHLERSEFEE